MSTGPLTEVRSLYRARYARDGDGWHVEIVEDPRVHTEGDTLAQARERILDALATWLDCEIDALPPVRDVLELPAGVDLGRLDPLVG